MHRQCGEREREPEGRKGISDGGRKGGLAGCGVHNRGRWMEREGYWGRTTAEKRTADGDFTCVAGERGREGGIGAVHECNAAEGLRI